MAVENSIAPTVLVEGTNSNETKGVNMTSQGEITSNQKQNNEIWIIGDIFVDIQAAVARLPPSWDSDTISYGTNVLPGGSGANTARQLHALRKTMKGVGPSVRFFGAVGDDAFGKEFERVERGFLQLVEENFEKMMKSLGKMMIISS